MTWSDEYNRKMRDAVLRRAILSGQSTSIQPGPKDIAQSILRDMKITNKKIEPSAKDKSFFTPSNVLHRYAQGGKNVLNLLSIGNYTTANATNRFLDVKREKGGINGAGDLLTAVGEALKGAGAGAASALVPADASGEGKEFADENRTTFGDVLKENHILDKNPKSRAALGFGLDVVADPLTYVGPGAVKAIVKPFAKTGAKAVEEVVSHAGDDVARVTTGKAEQILQEATKKAAADKPPALPPFETKPATQLHESVIDDLIGQVKMRRYPTDIESRIDPLFKTETKQVAKVVEDAAGESRQVPLPKTSVENPGYIARKQAKAEAGTAGLKFTDITPEHKITLYRSTGKVSGETTVANFERMLTHGIVPAKMSDKHFTDMGEEGIKAYDEWAKNFVVHSEDDLDKVFVKSPKSGELVPLQKVLDTLKIKPTGVKMSEVPEPPKAYRVEQTTEPVRREIMEEVASTRKLSKAEQVAWMTKYQDVLDPKDMEYLVASKNSNEFKNRLSKLVSRDATADYVRSQGVKGLREGIRTGAVDPASLEPLKQILKAKNNDDLLRKLAAAKKKSGENAVPSGQAVDEVASRAVDEAGRVRSADEIVEKVSKGDASDVIKRVNQLDTVQVEAVKNAIQIAITKNLVDPQDLEKYPFLSGILKTKRTAGVKNEGVGRNLKGWNKYAQADVFRELIKHSSGRLAQSSVKNGTERAAAAYEYTMPMIRAVEDVLKDAGVPMILGTGNIGLPMGMYDVLSALPRSLVQNILFNKAHSLLPTQFMDAAEIVLRMKYGKNVLDPDTARSAISALITNPVSFRNGKSINPDFLKWIVKMPEDKYQNVVKFTVDRFIDALPRLSANLERNSATWQIKVGMQSKAITDEVIDKVIKAFENPQISNGDRLEIVSNVDKLAEAIAKANKSMPAAKELAKNELRLQMGDTVEAAIAVEAKAAKVNKPTRASTERIIAAEELLTGGMDLPGKLELGFFGAVARGMNPHYKVGDLRKLYNEGHTMSEVVARGFGHLASQMAKKYSAEDIKRAWVAAQQGTNTVDDVSNAALSDMYNMLRSVFDANQEYNSIKRFGLTAEQLNKWFRHYGVPDAYRIDPKLMGETWRTWENVKDPLDLVTRVNAAVHQAQTLRTVGGSFSHFGKQTGAVSAVPKPGFVKLSGKGIEQLSPYFNLDEYYSKEAIEQLRYFNQFLRESQKPLAQNDLLKTLDTSLHMLKAGYTIYRPGHHMRNAVGNASLNFLAGVTDPRYYTDAARMLWNTKGRYADWDKLQAIRNLPVGQAERLSMEKATTKVRTSQGVKDLTDEQIVKLAANHGVLPDYHVLEDISFANSEVETAEFLKKLPTKIRKPFGGAVQQKAGQLSQINDHYFRMAQFLYEMKRGKYKGTLDEVAQQAARTVRKWHPDGTDLTNFERRVMRRTILFYSWQRKILPLVAESLVMRPGRVMVYPKAMYNFAEGMGIDLNSLADPFPQDQLFPSWLTSQATGPQFQNEEGHYIGFNPGVVQTDVINQYGDPEKFVRTLLGSTIPFVKIPFELAAGTNVSTGAPITDKSEYLDRQIPGLSYVGNITNTSPTQGFAPKREVEKGYENAGPDAFALINYLTGVGAIDMSKPNYIKSAEFELRDAYRKNNG